MCQYYFTRASQILLMSALTTLTAAMSVACKQDKQTTTSESPNESISTQTYDSKQVTPTATPKPEQILSASEEPNNFELGLDKASGAFSISQSAQSLEDWQLVVSQYQDAIAFMKRVPAKSPYFQIAQTKIEDYQKQIQSAKLKANRPRQIASPQLEPQIEPQIEPQRVTVRRVPKVIVPTAPKLSPEPPPIAKAKVPTNQPTPQSQLDIIPVLQQSELFNQKQEVVFTAPIKRRMGGTPVIEVTFNGTQAFEMIVDTGASGTVITQKMAQALGVATVGKAKANTASAKGVEFPIGYVDSIAVDGAFANRVPVAIAGPELETGLLGHDFFGNYEVTIKRDAVEFRPHVETQ